MLYMLHAHAASAGVLVASAGGEVYVFTYIVSCQARLKGLA